MAKSSRIKFHNRRSAHTANQPNVRTTSIKGWISDEDRRVEFIFSIADKPRAQILF